MRTKIGISRKLQMKWEWVPWSLLYYFQRTSLLDSLIGFSPADLKRFSFCLVLPNIKTPFLLGFYAFLPPFINKEQLIAVQIVFGNIPDSWDKASYSKRNPSYTKKITVRKQWYKYQQCESISPRKLYLKNIYNIPYMYTLQQVLTSSYNKQEAKKFRLP